MTPTHSTRVFARRLTTYLPTGRPLSATAFAARHRGILIILWLHVPALGAFAVVRGHPLLHAAAEAGLIAVFAVVATLVAGHRARALAAALGLVVSSSVLVHLWAGAIEGHFHFFVVMTVLALYQSWLPFMGALGFIILEHGIVGVVAASSVYAHPAGTANPWTWALIHGSFILASCVGNLLAWRLTEQEALHDGLTGLPNRILLLDVLEAALRGGDGQVAAVFLDLDGFKDINDGFGHETGDGLLIAVSRRLASRLRHGELLARLGGDEFAVILTGSSAADAHRVADRLVAAFDEPFVVGDLHVSVSASAGATLASQGSTALSLLHDADLAMYNAKRSGGDRSSLFQVEMRTAAAQRSALIADFPRALREGEFVVHYQPVFSLADQSTIGVEALVRWDHPTRGLVPPGDFIGAAEQSGFIVALGTHVLDVACRQAVLWREAFPDHRELVMSVNLSPRQLAEPELLRTVVAALAGSGLAAGSLCLEVTEGAVINDLEETLPKLRALATIGTRLALDDFGTGYSSLAYLQKMPIHVLKVDRSFVAALGEEVGSTAIVRTVIDLAHQLGMVVTAEGIETAEQLEVLRSLSCENGQGFLRARPAPAEEITQALVRERLGKRVPPPRQEDPAGGQAPALSAPHAGDDEASVREPG